MANPKIDIVGANDIPLVTDLYGRIFRPAREEEFFRRRFLGRYNVLMMIASLDDNPIGFYTGFELKPNVFFSWLVGVLPEYRRVSVAAQLMDASHEWAATHDYASVRFECHNQHRPMLHLAIEAGYDVVGIRWDPDRQSNLVIFEKPLNVEVE
jgi:GNAT superfamily N-acetyltransferase